MNGADDLTQKTLRALDFLFSQTSSNESRVAANAWLMEFQHHPRAWSISLNLLANSNKDERICFFACNALRSKILSNWNELRTTEERISMRDALLQSMLNFENGPSVVRARLAICVASTCAQMTGTDDWKDPIKDLTTVFSGHDLCLLLVLSELPIEANNSRMSIGNSTRRYVLTQLESQAAFVLSSLYGYLQNTQSDRGIQRRLIDAFANWVRYFRLNPSHRLQELLFPFDTMQVAELFEVSCDAVCQLIRATRHIHEYHAIVTELLPRCLELVPHFEAALQNNKASVVHKFSNIFVELGESYLNWILDTDNSAAQSILEAVLRCTTTPSKNISSKTFNFWFQTSEKVARMDDIQKREAKKQMLAPYFARVISCLKTVMTYPPSFDSWDADSEEHHRSKEYRYHAGKTLLDCVGILGLLPCLRLIWGMCNEEYERFKASNWTAWHGLEAGLYCFRSIGGLVDTNEKEIIPAVMTAVPDLTQFPALRYTATLIVGRYTKWINHNASFLEKVFPFVVGGMNLPETRASACKAFRWICEDCAVHLTGQFQGLLELYNNAFSLDIDSRVEVVTGVAHIVPVLSRENIAVGLNCLVDPVLVPLQQFLQSQQPNTVLHPSQFNSQNEILDDHLDALTAVFIALSPNHIDDADVRAILRQSGLSVVQKVYPVLTALMPRLAGSPRGTDKLFRVMKYFIRTFNLGLSPMVRDFVVLFTTQFEQSPTPHTNFVYLFGVCIDVFGRDPAHQQLLQQALRAFCGKLTQLLPNDESFAVHPDIVGDGFEMLEKTINVAPSLLFSQPDTLASVFRCGLNGLHADKRDAIRSVAKFYRALFETCVDSKQLNIQRGGPPQGEFVVLVQELLRVDGQTLIGRIVGSFATLPQERVSYSVNVFLQVLIIWKVQAMKWLYAVLGQIPETECPTKQEAFEALNQASKTVDLKEILNDFAVACRHAVRN